VGSASLTGKQKFGFFGNGCSRDTFACRCCDHFGFALNLFDFESFFRGLRFGYLLFLFGLGLINFGFVYFFLESSLLAQGDDMLGAFVSYVCGKFRAIGCAVRFDLRGIFGTEARPGFHVTFSRGFRFLFCIVFFLEDGATDHSIRFGFRNNFLVFGFREVGGQCCDLIVV